MDAATLHSFFGWCTVINYGVLLFWWIAYVASGGAVVRLHAGMFKLEEEKVRALHFQLMGAYKILIFIFCLAPWIAMHLVVG